MLTLLSGVVRGRALDEALFRSRLSRLKTCLEAERRYWKETGEGMEAGVGGVCEGTGRDR